MIAVIDYGVGNLFSLVSSLRYIGAESVVTRDKEIIKNADRIILPGVGAFKDAFGKLKSLDLVDLIKSEAKDGKPVLGICLGMQLLFERSYEYGESEGLSLIKGEVCPLNDDIPEGYKVPQMGWNGLHILKDSPIIKYTKENDYVYFVHSFYAKKCLGDTVAVTDYGAPVTAIVAVDNVYGTQFHPEKSGEAGLNILRAFNEIQRAK